MTSHDSLLDELVEESADALALVDPAALEFVRLNEALVRLTGLDRATLEREGPLATQVVAAGAMRDAEALRRQYAAAIAAHPRAVVEQGEMLRADGRRAAVESSMSAIRWEGRWLIAVGIRDTTEGQADTESARRLRFAFDQAGDAIALIDYDTLTYFEVNQAVADLFNHPREKLMSMGPGPVTNLSREQLIAMYTPLVQTPGRVVATDMAFLDAHGQLFYAETARRAVRSGDHWVIIACVRDVTRRKKAEDALAQRLVELQRANEELERFAYVASHDLTEPLRMISSYVQLLRRRYDSSLDADGRDFIRFAVEGAERMKSLLEDLLVYSRAGRTLKPAREMDLLSVMRDVTSNLEVLIKETGAKIETTADGPIMADRTALAQVLQNLVANAIRFMAAGRQPVVRVSSVATPDGWTVSVADNGIGIEERYFERIFHIFQRLHGRDEYAGTGIGLAVCKKLVERYGGRIWLESTPGAGTTFHFTLPREVTRAEPA
jgi:PAS domain S-box-containing protein